MTRPRLPRAAFLSSSDSQSNFSTARQKVVALGARHQTLLQRLVQVEADITAAVSLHESREAINAEEAQKV